VEFDVVFEGINVDSIAAYGRHIRKMHVQPRKLMFCISDK